MSMEVNNMASNKYENFVILFVYSISLLLSPGLCRKQFLNEINTVELQRQIWAARHTPVCVLFKNTEIVYPIEAEIADLPTSAPANDFTSWNFVSYIESRIRDPIVAPEIRPDLRCFLGAHNYYDYSQKYKLLSRNNSTEFPKVNQWLTVLEKIHASQLQEATRERIAEGSSRDPLTLIAFLGKLDSHHKIEEMLYEINKLWPNVSILLVHSENQQAATLAEEYAVRARPAAVFVERPRSVGERPRVSRVLQGAEVTATRLLLLIAAQFSGATRITNENFEAELLRKSKLYAPAVVLVHTASQASLQHLTAFTRTRLELQELGVQHRFGVFEVNETTRETAHHLHSLVKTLLPHTVLFRAQWKKTTVTGISQLALAERPTPLAVLEWLQENGALLNSFGQPVPLNRWWHSQHAATQISSVLEGPYGTQCTVYTHNATDNTPYEPPRKPKVIKPKKQPKNIFGSWHDRYASELADAGLRREAGLPVVTEASWAGVVERSYAPLHPFYPGERWRGEVTKVALVVFVIADCGSCSRNLPVFQQLYSAVKFVDGGSLYLANCTSDPELCTTHGVTGFPTLVAFRVLSLLDSSDCMPPGLSAATVRLDYHGPITVAAVMSWFARAAGSAVTNSRFSHLDQHDMSEDAHVVGTLVPRASSLLPRVATSRRDRYFYPYECLRLTCELLFAQVPCYVQYNDRVPPAEFSDETANMVVTKVELHRRDGVWSTVMSLGRPLARTLHEESASNINKFHQPHSYSLPPRLHCEDDHTSCTALLLDFTRDHSRLPVTTLTEQMFHTPNSLLFHKNLPLLVAFAYADNFTSNSSFFKELEAAAYSLYTRVAVAAVDVEEYPSWAARFVPRGYTHVLFDLEEWELPHLYVYPRLCLLQWGDHRHAAFHPPASVPRHPQQQYNFTAAALVEFATTYLQDPATVLVETEHF